MMMWFDVLGGALRLMSKGPKDVSRSLALSAQSEDADPELYSVAALLAYLESATAGDETASAFRKALATWDNDSSAEWCKGTEPNTAVRRVAIYEKLALTDPFVRLCDRKFPFKELETPVVIAKKHKRWYDEARRLARPFY